MNFIGCSRHPDQSILYLYLLPEETEFLCENCIEDGEINGLLIKNNKVITINTLIQKPEAIIKKLDLNDLQKIYTNFGNDNLISINEQIKEMEKQALALQQLIQEMILKFKNCVQNIESLRKQMFQDFIKDLNFEPLKQLAICLVQSKDATNLDSISQLKQKLHQYFQQLHKDNGQDSKNPIFTKISQTSNSVDQEIKQLENLNLLKAKLDQFHNEQFKIVTSIYPHITKQLQSTLFTIYQQYKILNLVKERQKCEIQNIQHIYLGSRDGLNNQSFWAKVNGKKNLLMILKSKTNYIFGGYSPCQRSQNLKDYVQDKTNSSFLFSQTHDEIYPLVNNQKAIFCHSSYGPTFGGGYDMNIADDFQNGSSKLGSSYKWDIYIQINHPVIYLVNQLQKQQNAKYLKFYLNDIYQFNKGIQLVSQKSSKFIIKFILAILPSQSCFFHFVFSNFLHHLIYFFSILFPSFQMQIENYDSIHNLSYVNYFQLNQFIDQEITQQV